MVGAEAGLLLGLLQPPPLVEQEDGGGEEAAEDEHQARAGPEDDEDELTALALLTDGLEGNLALRCSLLCQAVGLSQESDGRAGAHLVLHVERDGVVSAGLQLVQAELRPGEGEPPGGVELGVGEDRPVPVLQLRLGSLLSQPAANLQGVPGLVHHLAVTQEPRPAWGQFFKFSNKYIDNLVKLSLP